LAIKQWNFRNFSQEAYKERKTTVLSETTITAELWDTWHSDASQFGLSIPDWREKFNAFYDLLIETNKQFNLTRITAPEDFLYRHLLDSLTLLPLIPPQAKLIDVGSGAGFPAIPLAIARPDITVVALESLEKKCGFIRQVKESLKLENLSVEKTRAEDYAHVRGVRESYDLVTARAVAALPALLELCLPFVKVKGTFLAMKGRASEDELASAQKALGILGGQFLESKTFDHPRLEGSRLLLIQKIKAMPAKYPRTAGTPAKNPL
jgi:16S rRNA (guanine527-N7)-methyltransferase